MYKICFFVPETDVDIVKAAMFDAGAGRIGDYDACSWQTAGTGQFRPLENSNPHIGQHGRIEKVTEFKVEMVCDERYINDVITALKSSHPYEEPAYEVIKLENY